MPYPSYDVPAPAPLARLSLETMEDAILREIGVLTTEQAMLDYRKLDRADPSDSMDIMDVAAARVAQRTGWDISEVRASNRHNLHGRIRLTRRWAHHGQAMSASEEERRPPLSTHEECLRVFRRLRGEERAVSRGMSGVRRGARYQDQGEEGEWNQAWEEYFRESRERWDRDGQQQVQPYYPAAEPRQYYGGSASRPANQPQPAASNGLSWSNNVPLPLHHDHRYPYPPLPNIPAHSPPPHSAPLYAYQRRQGPSADLRASLQSQPRASGSGGPPPPSPSPSPSFVELPSRTGQYQRCYEGYGSGKRGREEEYGYQEEDERRVRSRRE